MGRLDKRAARDEDDRAAREYKQQAEQAYERYLRGQEIAAAQAAEQETLVAEVYDLVDEFLDLMEEQDYPGLETATLPMTRWWWPFRIPTRKAVWKLIDFSKSEMVEYLSRAEPATGYHDLKLNVYLVAEDEELIYYKSEKGVGSSQHTITCHEWQGEAARSVRDKLRELIAEYSR